MARLPQINQASIRGATKYAVDNWFFDIGIVGKKGQIEASRTLESYGLKAPDVQKLSLHVIDVVKGRTGVDFKVTTNQLGQFAGDTIESYIKGTANEFIAALPGKPTTLPRTTKKGFAALPGKPVTRPRPRAKR